MNLSFLRSSMTLIAFVLHVEQFLVDFSKFVPIIILNLFYTLFHLKKCFILLNRFICECKQLLFFFIQSQQPCWTNVLNEYIDKT